MADLIFPTVNPASTPIIMGADWWCTFGFEKVGQPVSLDGYEIEACFFNLRGTNVGSLAVGPLTIGSGITRITGEDHRFRVDLTKEQTAGIQAHLIGHPGSPTALSMAVDVTRTGSDDLVTGYATGQTFRAFVATLMAYPKGSAAADQQGPGDEDSNLVVTIELGTGEIPAEEITLGSIPGLDATNVPAAFEELAAQVDKQVEHAQPDASTQWTISHGLGKFPNVQTFDEGLTQINGVVTHIDNNNLVIDFDIAVSGVAYLN